MGCATMREYTINGTTHYVQNDRLYAKTGEAHSIEDIGESGAPYLYDGRVVKLSVRRGTVTLTTLGDGATRYIGEEEFDPAPLLEPLRPDGVAECPDCGGWAGPADDPEHQFCIDCGWDGPGT